MNQPAYVPLYQLLITPEAVIEAFNKHPDRFKWVRTDKSRDKPGVFGVRQLALSLKPALGDLMVEVMDEDQAKLRYVAMNGRPKKASSDIVVFLHDTYSQLAAPPWKSLEDAFKTREDLAAAWPRLRIVVTPECNNTSIAPGVHAVRNGKANTLSDEWAVFEVLSKLGARLDLTFTLNGLAYRAEPENPTMYLVLADEHEAKVERKPAKARELAAPYTTPASDLPGIKRMAALPPATQPTPAPTYAPPKGTAVAGLLVVHNPDDRHSKFGGAL